MENINSNEYGIRYKVTKTSDKTFILSPIDIVEGYSVGETFYSSDILKTLYDIESLEEAELVDSIINVDLLKGIYEYDDEGFIREYYLSEEKDYIILVAIENGRLYKRKINLHKLTKREENETYERQKGEPAVTLNCDALEKLINSENCSEIKAELERYRRLIQQFRDKEKKEGITNITVQNGHVTGVSVNKKVDQKAASQTAPNIQKQTSNSEFDMSDFSITGLERYIKERVIGHDEVISDLATIMYMNFTAKEEYGTQSILLLGETGTGKTITARCAADYFGLPFEEINTPNIVPQGIKGTTLEDHLYSLILQCNGDVKKAQRAFIFLDEFDKIGMSELEIKSAVISIFLKFIEGGEFHLDKPTDDYVFNTRMLNKVFAGAFTNLFEKKTPLGFGATTQENERPVFKESLITQGEYFGKELVTRIPHNLVYYPLTREQKRLVLLESKLSQYLLKKKRYQEEFGIELEATDSYVEAILDLLSAKDKSMRDLNNLILNNLIPAEKAMSESQLGQYKKLTLTADTVADRHNFDLR